MAAETQAKRSLRIIGVISFMNAAGAQEALLRLNRQLRRRGHDMDVWFLYEEAPVFRGEPHTDTFIRKPRLSPLEYVSVFFRLVGRLRREKPDVVVGFLPLGAVFGALSGLLAGVKVRVASQRAPGPTFGRVMRLLDKAWGMTGVYTDIVCVSGAVKDSFDSYPAAYRRKLSVVHNGIEVPPTPPSREAARSRVGLTEDRVMALAVGRMKMQKNYLFLLDRVAETEGFELWIAGDGELRPAIEQRIADLGIGDRVRLLGNVDREGVTELLAACDIFVQASLYEGQSNAVLEAMHAGCAMVLSDIPMQRETVCEGGKAAALLVDLSDHTSWMEKLSRLKQEPSLRQQLGSTARSMVQKRFALDRMVDGFEGRFCQSQPGEI